MAARFVQGFAGGWAMVIARAVIVDLARGAQLVRMLNLVAGVGGIAPIVGPLLGAVILQLSHWRVSFWAVAALGAAMIVAVAGRRTGVAARRAAARRRAANVRRRRPARCSRHRRFVGYLIVMPFHGCDRSPTWPRRRSCCSR